MEIAALIVGLVGLILSLNIFTSFTGLILSILAIIFGIIGITKKGPDKGKAVAGLILGLVSLVILVVVTLVVINLVGYFADSLPQMLEELAELYEGEVDSLLNRLLELLETAQSNALSNLF